MAAKKSEQRVEERTAELTETNERLRREMAERTRAEKALRQSEKLLRATLESTADGILVVDENGRVTHANSRMWQMWRVPDELVATGDDATLLGHATAQLVDPDGFFAKVEALYQSPDEDFDTLDFLDGRAFERYSCPLVHSGEVAGRVWSFRDITERKRAQEALRRSEQEYRTLLQRTQAAVVVHGADTQIMAHNAKAQELLGLAEDQMLGRAATDPDWMFLRADGEPMPKEEYPVNRVLSTRQPLTDFTVGVRRPDKADTVGVSVHADPVFNDQGNISQVIVTFVNITQRKRAEEALLASEARNRTLLQGSPVCIKIVDLDSRLRYMSAAGQEQLKIADVEPFYGGAFPPDLYPMPWKTRATEHLERAKLGEVSSVECCVLDTEGNELWYDTTFVPARDEQGRIESVIVTSVNITERRLAEQALLDSENRYRTLMQTAPAVIMNVERDATIQFINRTFPGYSVEDTLGTSILDYIDAEYHDTVLEKIRHVFETGQSDGFEVAAQGPHGRPSWYSTQMAPVMHDGHVIAATLVSTDVTERVEAKTALRESERKYRELADFLPQPVFETDTQGIILIANQSAFQFFGYLPEDLADGLNVSDMVVPDDRQRVIDDVRMLLRGDGPDSHEYLAQTKGGNTFPIVVHISAVYRKNKPIGIRGVIFDITQRKRAEEELRRSESRLRNAQRVAQLGFWDHDTVSGDLYWSEETYRIFGHSEESFGKTYGAFLDAVHPEDRAFVERCVEDALQRDASYNIDHRIVRPDGEVRHVHELGEVTRDADGRAIRMVGTLIDITQRKRAEKALRKGQKLKAEAEKLAATGRMAAQVAHEINNPLAGIKNSFRLIRDAVPEDHPDRDMVGRIEREIDRIAHIVRQMYKLHSPRKQALAEVPVEQTIHDVLAMLEPLCREHEVTIELAPISTELTAMAPEGSLQQVLYNLLTNAIQASPRMGTVNILAEPTDMGTIRISVRDQGPGIPAEVQQRMFEPFFSVNTSDDNRERIGLGLSVVRSIVESVGGRIECTSRVGQGACFHVYLSAK